MNRIRLILSLAAFLVAILLGTGTFLLLRHASAATVTIPPPQPQDRVTKYYPNFNLDVLVNGRPLQEYYARGRTYVEALQGAEYELRLRNDSSDRVAVALSVDGLNTIDARHTSAWNASKWVIEPYQTITISGWQMSSERARRFYFTNERDSYGAKLGQTANLGVISAVFFREQRRVSPPYPISKNRDRSEPQQSGSDKEAPASKSQAGAAESRAVAPLREDDYAATGIGRNVRNDVYWVNMDLDSRAAGEVTIRYEYYSALLKLGVVPRHESWQRREDSRGFSPEP
jgi:hypothetical protein